MSYARTTTVDSAPAGDTVKRSVLDVDTDLTGIFAHLNTHESATTGIHGAGTGTIASTTGTQTLSAKTLSSPIITGTVDCTGATLSSPTITGATITGTLSAPIITGTVDCSGATLSSPTITGATTTGGNIYDVTIRSIPRITTIISHATPTINTDNCDAVTITALAEAITSMTTNLSGSPYNFQKLIFRIKDNGTARAITWGAKFVAKGTSLPTTTVLGKLLTVGFIYDTVLATWGCVASSQEA